MKNRLDEVVDNLCAECKQISKKEYIGRILSRLNRDDRMAGIRTVSDIAAQYETHPDRKETKKDSVNNTFGYFQGQIETPEPSDPQKFSSIVALSIFLKNSDGDIDTASQLIDAIFCHVTIPYAEIVRRSKR